MTNEQLYMAIGVPIFFNGIIAVVLTTLFSARLSDVRSEISAARAEFRELAAAERRAWDANFRHMLDKLDEMDGRLGKIEDRR